MSRKLMLEDLSRSGLTLTDATKLKVSLLTRATTKKLFGLNVYSYKLPYFDIKGKPTDFYRVRFLEEGTGLKRVGHKYTQEKDTGVHLYLTPYIKWTTVSGNTEIPVMITEGEKKAATACKNDIPTIGLGGVWSFLEEKRLLSEFNWFKWKQRTVWVVFDSDLRTNSLVRKAMIRLAGKLTELGANVHFGYLPDSEAGKKVGLDDYLLTHSKEELFEIETEEYKLCRDLWDMNDEVALIEDTSRYLIVNSGNQFSKRALLDGNYSDRLIILEEEEHNLFNLWTRWKQRRRHTRMCYSPGQFKTTKDNEYNLWNGWGCEPKKGSIKPWNNLLDYVFSDDKEFREWFVKWLAYPLQHPGTKMYTSVLIWSLDTGTGKSLIGYIMGKIYGENFVEIGEEDIHGDFNDWIAEKQFVMGDEITGSDSRRDADRIKRMITREKVSVNIKHQPIYRIIDCVNYYLTSNRPDALFMDTSDRRMAIHQITALLPPQEFYDEIDAWKDNNGPAALFYHLLNEVDCSSFNPKARAPLNKSKLDMIEINRSDLDTFAHYLKDDPDSYLIHHGLKLERDLYTAQELVSIYDNEGAKRTTNIAMSKALSRAGFHRLPMTKTKDGNKKLWIIRNIDYWKRASPVQRAHNYDKDKFDKDANGKVVRIAKYKKAP